MSYSPPFELSIAERIPLELWERIVYYAIARVDTFLGPPTEIPNLCIVSRSLNYAICFNNNPSLYARLFCFKFDYEAPLRRLGKDCLTVWPIAREFKKRIAVLKQVRRRECSIQHLWTCYLMMLENDGKNERQLVEWAGLYGYLKRETCARFKADLSSPINWFQDTEGTSLILWLWWMTFSRADLRIENPHIRDSLVTHLLHNFVVASFRYPSFHGPESHLHLPLSSDASLAWCSSPPTPVARVNHYSTDLDLATPLLSLASLLVWTVRLETIRESATFNHNTISLLPLDSAQGPTQADVLKFHESQIQAPAHCPLTLRTSFTEQILASGEEEISQCSLPLTGSRRYDEDLQGNQV